MCVCALNFFFRPSSFKTLLKNNKIDGRRLKWSQFVYMLWAIKKKKKKCLWKYKRSFRLHKSQPPMRLLLKQKTFWEIWMPASIDLHDECWVMRAKRTTYENVIWIKGKTPVIIAHLGQSILVMEIVQLLLLLHLLNRWLSYRKAFSRERRKKNTHKNS